MAIYIKGVELPKTAFECSTKVNPDERRCNYTGKVFEETYGLVVEHACPDCPLIEVPEPHGRLIDADKLIKGIDIKIELTDIVEAKKVSDAFNEIISRIKNAPTVIEGSE